MATRSSVQLVSFLFSYDAVAIVDTRNAFSNGRLFETESTSCGRKSDPAEEVEVTVPNRPEGGVFTPKTPSFALPAVTKVVLFPKSPVLSEPLGDAKRKGGGTPERGVAAVVCTPTLPIAVSVLALDSQSGVAAWVFASNGAVPAIPRFMPCPSLVFRCKRCITVVKFFTMDMRSELK